MATDIEFSHLETNLEESKFSFATNTNNTYESPAMDNIPGPFVATAYNKNNFVYDNFNFLNPGLSDLFQDGNGYPTGIGGLDRFAGGAYYFLMLFPDPDPADPINLDAEITDCDEPPVKGRTFWEYISTAWDFLITPDRETFENFWFGLTIAGRDMLRKAQRFEIVIAPEDAEICVLEDYYDIHIGILFARPTQLDQTIKEPNFNIRPIATRLIEPTYEADGTPINKDLIEVTARDYYNVREVGLDDYVVVTPKSDSIKTKYFTVSRLLSSEEAQDRPASMQIDETVGVFKVTPSPLGRIRFTADDFMEDVSEYDIMIQFIPGGPNSVTWTTNGYHAVLDSIAMDWEISDLITASNTAAPNRWATLLDISPKGNLSVPIIQSDLDSFPGDAVKFKNLPNYVNAEAGEGRHFPSGGFIWKYFEGYTAVDGPEGDLTVGEYVDNVSLFKYIIEVNGSLAYLGIEQFNIYFTSGLSYDVAEYVSDLPFLQDTVDGTIGSIFKKDVDYLFYNNTIEFFENIFDQGIVSDDLFLYNPKTPVIENYLYDRYGAETNIVGWQEFNYNNASGRAGIAGALKSLQNSSNTIDYERAMNIYYGLPIAPDDSDVIGLYESYLYPVIAISGSDITLDIPENTELHPFIQINTIIFPDGKKETKVTGIVDRMTGIITVDDVSNIEVGTGIYVKLPNKYFVKNFYAEDKANEIPAHIDIFSPAGAGAIQHLIDLIQARTNGEEFPEILVYNTDKLENNYDGVYHITSAEEFGSVTRLHLYLPKSTDEEVLYNDFIGVTTEIVQAGLVHIPWPTHKFLYLYMRNENKYYKAYLDAPIDTIYDQGDTLKIYDVIARNIAVLDSDKFPGWEQFDEFRRQNGMNLQSDYVELTNMIPNAEFGKYFPSQFIDSILLL